MITEMNAFHLTTKAAVAKALAELGVELSPSRVKKTPLADLIRMLEEAIATRKAEEAEPKKARRAASNVVPIAAAKKRKSAGVNLPAKPAGQLKACRAGSKQAILIDHLAKGATLAELVAALKPWSESSVKSALYWDVAKVKGYGVRTETSDDDTQRYHLVLPKGVEAPLRHVQPAPVKVAANRR
jgi:hypothetical protein